MWTAEQIAAAKGYEGTCTSEVEIAETLNIDEDEVTDLLLEANIECCSGCGWWFAAYDLEFDESTGQSRCEDCQDEKDAEDDD